MKQARLGRLDVARIGFGAMGMSAYYTGAREDDEQSIRTIHRAIDLGVTLIDTVEGKILHYVLSEAVPETIRRRMRYVR